MAPRLQGLLFTALLLFLLFTRTIIFRCRLRLLSLMLLVFSLCLGLLLFFGLPGIEALMVGIVDGERLKLWACFNVLLYLLPVLEKGGRLPASK